IVCSVAIRAVVIYPSRPTHSRLSTLLFDAHVRAILLAVFDNECATTCRPSVRSKFHGHGLCQRVHSRKSLTTAPSASAVVFWWGLILTRSGNLPLGHRGRPPAAS